MSMSLCFAFPDGSAGFVNGYEAGLVGHRMEQGEAEISSLIPLHTENLELYRRMSAHYGYDMEEQPTELEEWTYVEFHKLPPQPKIPHLRLVKG
jgi:hypothetical protein